MKRLLIKSKTLLDRFSIISLFLLILVSSCGSRRERLDKYSSVDRNLETTNTKNSYKVIGIVDGDTYDILADNHEVRIRMDAIDAPERGMPYYKVSKKYLSSLIFGKFIEVDIFDEDSRGRIIAHTYSNGLDISAEMLSAGLAWHYKEHNNEDKYSELEINARSKKLGLWADENPYKPWEIRKLHREGVSTKYLFENKVD